MARRVDGLEATITPRERTMGRKGRRAPARQVATDGLAERVDARWLSRRRFHARDSRMASAQLTGHHGGTIGDRKSTRLNSSHSQISYAVFCLKKKKKKENNTAMH